MIPGDVVRALERARDEEVPLEMIDLPVLAGDTLTYIAKLKQVISGAAVALEAYRQAAHQPELQEATDAVIEKLRSWA